MTSEQPIDLTTEMDSDPSPTVLAIMQSLECMQLRQTVYLAFQRLAVHHMHWHIERRAEATNGTSQPATANGLETVPSKTSGGQDGTDEPPALPRSKSLQTQPNTATPTVATLANLDLVDLTSTFLRFHGNIIWPEYEDAREHLLPKPVHPGPSSKIGAKGLYWPRHGKLTPTGKRDLARMLKRQPTDDEELVECQLGEAMWHYFRALFQLFPSLESMDSVHKPVDDGEVLLRDIVGERNLNALRRAAN